MTTTVGAFGVVSAPVQSTCLYLPSTIVPQYPVAIRVCTPKGALRVCQLYSCVRPYRSPRVHIQQVLSHFLDPRQAESWTQSGSLRARWPA